MITRTFYNTRFKICQFVYENGKPGMKELETVEQVFTSKPQEASLLKQAKRKHVIPNIIVVDVKIEEVVLGIEVDEFVKYAKPVVRPSSQKVKKENK